ncbi:MAG: response regulator [Pseudomonadales bacterium]
MSSKRVLVVEDESDIREILIYNLRREGFIAEGYASGREGLEAIKRLKPDLVILDLMLPELDGLTVCQQVRADPSVHSTPIIIVSAKEEESDIILGLGLGADDYMTKPFSPRELIARVKAVLRRGQAVSDGPQNDRITIGELVIDVERHEVTVGDESIPLTATEFKLLHQLASFPGRAFSREQLLNRALGEGVVVVDRNIDVHIRAVRKKLGSLADSIETVRGIGYRFADPRSDRSS